MSQCPAGQVCVGRGATVATNQTTAAIEHKVTKDLQAKKDLVKKIKDLPKKTDKKKVLEEDKKLLKQIKSTVTKLEMMLEKIDFEAI